MLVVARKQHEFIQIGDDIIVKVIKTSRGSVKIGIDAPDGLRVLRGEITMDELDTLFDTKPMPRREKLQNNSNHAQMKPIGAVS